MGGFRSALIGFIGALLIGCGFSVSSAWAGYIITLEQVGPSVVATGNGAIDLAGLTVYANLGYPPYIQPNIGRIWTGAMYSNATAYTGASGPTSFGTGTGTAANSASGDWVGIGPLDLLDGLVFVPLGYISGSPLSDSATYDNATFSSLGVTPGTYEWTWGIGQNQNFTLIAVPEPRAGLLLGFGLLLLVGMRLRKFRAGSGAA